MVVTISMTSESHIDTTIDTVTWVFVGSELAAQKNFRARIWLTCCNQLSVDTQRDTWSTGQLFEFQWTLLVSCLGAPFLQDDGDDRMVEWQGPSLCGKWRRLCVRHAVLRTRWDFEVSCLLSLFSVATSYCCCCFVASLQFVIVLIVDFRERLCA